MLLFDFLWAVFWLVVLLLAGAGLIRVLIWLFTGSDDGPGFYDPTDGKG